MCDSDSINYPERILPQGNWGISLHGSRLQRHTPDAVLGHRLADSIDKCIITDPVSQTSIIEAKYLQTVRVINLSTSILGGAFQIEDFAFVQKESGSKDWDCTAVVDLKNFEEGVDYCLAPKPFCVVGWGLSGLENLEVPFHRTFKTKEAFEAWQSRLSGLEPEMYGDSSAYDYLEAFKNITTPSKFPFTTENIKATVHMIHRPTNLNYWHITLDIFPFDSPEFELKKDDANVKVVKNRTLRLIVDQLRSNYLVCDGSFTIPDIAGWEDLVTYKG